jgi:hypothetical protein
MTAESIPVKRNRLLTEHRVYIRLCQPEHVLASVRGDTSVHDIDLTAGRWSCSCPAMRTCSHLEAVFAVTVPESSTKEPHDHD